MDQTNLANTANTAAQAVPGAEPAVHATTGFLASIIHGIQDSMSRGDPWLILILISFAFGIAFTIERFWRLFFKYYVNGASFMFEVQKYILANDLDGAIRVCNSESEAALPKVLKAGLQRASRNEEQIQNAIDAASLEVIPKLERRLNYIALVANIAVLLGLLGTIAGLVTSFQAIGGGAEVADPAQRQAMLSQGVADAMISTALGLITAITTMVSHSVLANKAGQITEEIDEFGVKLMDLLSARKFRHSTQEGQE